MTTTQCKCPLCEAPASAADIDYGIKARVYCPACSTYDLTRTAFMALRRSSSARRKELAQRARSAPPGELLVIGRDAAAYEDLESKADIPAPSWIGAALR